MEKNSKVEDEEYIPSLKRAKTALGRKKTINRKSQFSTGPVKKVG